MVNGKQFPHVKLAPICIACGRPKHIGLLVCVECHNAFSMRHDVGYGEHTERLLAKADEVLARTAMSGS